MFNLKRSPLEMCSKLNFLTILEEIVPLPDAGAPNITDLNNLLAILDELN